MNIIVKHFVFLVAIFSCLSSSCFSTEFMKSDFSTPNYRSVPVTPEQIVILNEGMFMINSYGEYEPIEFLMMTPYGLSAESHIALRADFPL